MMVHPFFLIVELTKVIMAACLYRNSVAGNERFTARLADGITINSCATIN
jgi:hypothetical protein